LEDQAAAALAIAKPALDNAKNALNCLDKNSMTELKGFSKLPVRYFAITYLPSLLFATNLHELNVI
jgi:dynein heavy chain